MRTIGLDPDNYAGCELDGLAFLHDGRAVEFRTGVYANGRLAITIVGATDESFRLLVKERDMRDDDAFPGEPVATLTVNLVDNGLRDGEVFVKLWSENEGVGMSAYATGAFESTERAVQTGNHAWSPKAAVWRVKI